LYLVLFCRTVILYLAVLLAVRVMGKREVGELSAFDLVVAIMIAELAAMAVDRLDLPLYHGMIPIFTLVGMEMLFSWFSLKNHMIRGLVEGMPSIVIDNGKIVEKELRRLRYSLSDLLGQLRQKDIYNIADVQFAILETSGDLSVVLKADKRPLTPEDLGLSTKLEWLPAPLIFDGKIHRNNLAKLNLDESWLLAELKKRGIAKAADALFASLDCDGQLFVSKKDNSS